jgi:type III secretion protein U
MSQGSSGEKTEEPTPKKLRDARKKGQVVKSKEVAPVAVFVALLGALMMGSDYFYLHLQALFDAPYDYISADFRLAFGKVLEVMLRESAMILIPILAVTFVAALVSQIGQIGFLFSGEPIKIDFKKINPVEGFKRIFSIKSLFEFVKSIIKILLLTLIMAVLLKSELREVFLLPFCGLDCLLPFTGKLLLYMLAVATIGMLIIAILDYAFEYFQHRKQLRMTKDEVKREYKETEGSPEIKGRRRQLHQEMQNEEIKSGVQESTLLVTNPTHISVGIFYDPERAKLPLVTLILTEKQALYAREVAKEEGIPILERVPLARGLYADAEEYHFIPSEYIESIAEVIHWVNELKANSGIEPSNPYDSEL